VAGFFARGAAIAVTIRSLLLIFLRRSVYQETMNRQDARQDRPDIVAATRGGDDSVGMHGEADPATASLEQAMFWRNIYSEILTMEEAVLARIKQLMADQSPQAREEVELTNVPVVAAQADRFRSRLGFWESRVEALSTGAVAVAELVTPVRAS
jgi:hypothetical protein